MVIPEKAFIKYLVSTTCECQEAKQIILDYLSKVGDNQ